MKLKKKAYFKFYFAARGKFKNLKAGFTPKAFAENADKKFKIVLINYLNHSQFFDFLLKHLSDTCMRKYFKKKFKKLNLIRIIFLRGFPPETVNYWLKSHG